MYQIIMTNPLKKPGKKSTKRKNPMAKRRRKLSPAQLRAGFGGKRRKTRRNPLPAVRRRRSSAPRRRRAAAAPVARRRRVRRNPLPMFRRRSGKRSGITGSFMSAAVPALVGAGGALLLDFAYPYLPIPATMQTNPIAGLAIRAAGAVGIGLTVGMVAGKRYGREAMIGALLVTAYDGIKGWMATSAAASTPAGVTNDNSSTAANAAAYVGYYSAARNVGGDPRRHRMGAYVQ